jgi:hypothetical protein
MMRLIVVVMYYLQLEMLLPSLCQILINAWFCCRLINVENTEGTIKNGQSSEIGNKTKKIKTKTQHNMC